MIRILSLATLLTILSAASAQSFTIGGSVTIGQPQRIVRYQHVPVRYTTRYVVETRPVRQYNDYRYVYVPDYRYSTNYRNDGVIRDTSRDYAYDRVRNVHYRDPYYERVYYDNIYRAPRRDGAVIRIQIHP